MNTDIFEVIFGETVADWQAGNLSANDAMEVMARLKLHWKRKGSFNTLSPAAERPSNTSIAPDSPCGK